MRALLLGEKNYFGGDKHRVSLCSELSRYIMYRYVLFVLYATAYVSREANYSSAQKTDVKLKR